MADWSRVIRELREAGYAGFEFDSGETAVPGVSGEWVVGTIPREAGLKHENQSLLLRVLDVLPGSGGAAATNPENAPDSIRNVAIRHGLEVVIISVSSDEARIALCESSEKSTSA